MRTNASRVVLVTLLVGLLLSPVPFITSGPVDHRPLSRTSVSLPRFPDPLGRVLGAVPGSDSGLTVTAGDVAMVSRTCDHASNAEVEQAVDPKLGYVYEDWMGSGCGGIAFSRSTDGGQHFSPPTSVPGSVGSTVNSWDPAVAVAPNGTVYAAFMRAKDNQWNPVVAASFDHGVTFSQVVSLQPPAKKNWGDRDFIAVAPNGTVYVTWDYGPIRSDVTFVCAAGGSCGFSTGDLNIVIQWSTDGGRTWGPIIPVSPGFPWSGGDLAPILVEPDGQVDVMFQDYPVINTTTAALAPAHMFFTRSTDGGSSWSPPVMLGPANLTMSVFEWWIDDALAIDSAGNLYATWDTQGARQDVGWLSFSTDHGQTWSSIRRVTPDHDLAAHIVEVTAGGPGRAYIAWLADNASRGWALYLRVYQIGSGFMTPTIQISVFFGNPSVWPGDTFGISTLAATQTVLSWGSGIMVRGQARSQIFAVLVQFSS